MKNVLIIVERFPVTGGSRIDNFVKYLSRFGWQPIVLTTRYNDNSYGRKILENGFSNNIKVVRAFSLIKTPFRILSKYFSLYETTAFLERLVFIPDPAITWIFPAILKGINLIKDQNIKLILSSSPPESVHLLGSMLSKLTGKRWVADFRDLYTHYRARYKPPTIIHDKINKTLEKNIFQKADHVIANTEENREIYIKGLNVPKEKITVITNGYDPEDLHKILTARPTQEKGEFNIGYMGYFDKPFFPWRQFLINLKKFVNSKIEKKIRLNIYGYVSIKAINFIETNNISHFVRFHGEFSHADAIKLAAQNDLLLLLLHEDESSSAIVPLKLYSYLIMNKPILAIAPKNGAVARIIASTNIGNTISIKKNGELFNALNEYYENWLSNKKITFNPNLEQIKKYNIKYLTQYLSEVFEKMLIIHPS